MRRDHIPFLLVVWFLAVLFFYLQYGVSMDLVIGALIGLVAAIIGGGLGHAAKAVGLHEAPKSDIRESSRWPRIVTIGLVLIIVIAILTHH